MLLLWITSRLHLVHPQWDTAQSSAGCCISCTHQVDAVIQHFAQLPACFIPSCLPHGAHFMDAVCLTNPQYTDQI